MPTPPPPRLLLSATRKRMCCYYYYYYIFVSRVCVCMCVYVIRPPQKEEIEIILYCSKRAEFYRWVRDTKLRFITR